MTCWKRIGHQHRDTDQSFFRAGHGLVCALNEVYSLPSPGCAARRAWSRVAHLSLLSGASHYISLHRGGGFTYRSESQPCSGPTHLLYNAGARRARHKTQNSHIPHTMTLIVVRRHSSSSSAPQHLRSRYLL